MQILIWKEDSNQEKNVFPHFLFAKFFSVFCKSSNNESMVVSSLCIKQCFLGQTYQKCTKNSQKSQKNRTHVLQLFSGNTFPFRVMTNCRTKCYVSQNLFVNMKAKIEEFVNWRSLLAGKICRIDGNGDLESHRNDRDFVRSRLKKVLFVKCFHGKIQSS